MSAICCAIGFFSDSFGERQSIFYSFWRMGWDFRYCRNAYFSPTAVLVLGEIGSVFVFLLQPWPASSLAVSPFLPLPFVAWWSPVSTKPQLPVISGFLVSLSRQLLILCASEVLWVPVWQTASHKYKLRRDLAVQRISGSSRTIAGKSPCISREDSYL